MNQCHKLSDYLTIEDNFHNKILKEMNLIFSVILVHEINFYNYVY